MTDCIIIGSGPAGLSAGLTLKANGKNFQIFGKKTLSDKISKAEKIRNYLGLADIKGEDFCKAIRSQLAQAEIEITEEKVSGIYALDGKFGVATQEGGYYESKTVLLACGVESVKAVEGETEFIGRGVSFCATCDGFLYKDKTIAVLCTSKSLEHEIAHLAQFAKKVYLAPMYKDVAVQAENVEIIKQMPVAVAGRTRVEEILFKERSLAVDGVFFLRESLPPATLLSGLEMHDGHIRVDRNMQTNILGCFASGDCTGRPYQYAKAVGEGNVASHAISEYLAKNKRSE